MIYRFVSDHLKKWQFGAVGSEPNQGGDFIGQVSDEVGTKVIDQLPEVGA